MRPTVFLFDIDGTLVTCGGAGRRAMERAFREQTTRAVSDFPFGGMTDRAIARQALEAAGLAPDEALIDHVLERYLAHLADELPRSAGYRVLEGVSATLDAIEGLRDQGLRLAIGLGTGNLIRGAELKLRPGGLWHRFSFGGFGSDDEDRPTLLRRGAARGARSLEQSVDDVSVIVIGDTPRDVTAARAMGAGVVAVASGSYDRAALAPHEPDLLVESLAELEIEALLRLG
ncbi:MAG: HAD family hydrolase [Sandaracinus sp.]